MSSWRTRARGAPHACHPITRPARGICLVLPNACWVVQNSGGLSSRTIDKRNTGWLSDNHSEEDWKGPRMLKGFSESLCLSLSVEVGFGEAETEGRVCSPRTGFPSPQEQAGCPFSLKQKSPGDLAVLSSVLGLEISWLSYNIAKVCSSSRLSQLFPSGLKKSSWCLQCLQCVEVTDME